MIFQKEYDLGFVGKFTGNALMRAIQFSKSFPEPTVINPDFLLDLGEANWNVSWYGNDRAVIFESGCCKAVIMPLHYE